MEYKYDLLNILRLIRTEGIGPRTFHKLIKEYKSAGNSLEMLSKQQSLKSLEVGIINSGGNTKKTKEIPIKNFSTITSIEDAISEIEQVRKLQGEIITYIDPSYPKLLKEIPDFPPVLTLLGNKELLNSNIVAIVGSREASLNGMAYTSKLAATLSRAGFVIASGMARGIDKTAHEASLSGGTIAVIAGGINHIYPIENKNLYEKIKQSGLIISELPINTVPKAQNFPQRNRIIAGISSAVIVTESLLNSGSLITALKAKEYGRKLLSVPGFPYDRKAEGCNKLIKEGAFFIDNIDSALKFISENKSIVDDQAFKTIPKESNDNCSNLEKDEKMQILNLLSTCPTDIDMLLKHTGMPAKVLNSVISELELFGKIMRMPGNKLVLL